MDTKLILADLRAERDRIDQAIAALEGLTTSKRGASSAASSVAGTRARGRRRMSAAARKRISQKMKQRWAERKKKAKTA